MEKIHGNIDIDRVLAETEYDTSKETDDLFRQYLNAKLRTGILSGVSIFLEDIDIYWPYRFGEEDGQGGVKPKNPLEIHLTSGELGDTLNGITYKVDLRDMTREALADIDFTEEPSLRKGFREIAAALRTLADEVDVAVAD